MRITVARNPKELGEEAARLTAGALIEAVRKKGWARLALSTGATQLEAISALTRQNLPWQQIEVFQVCERAGLEDDDPASSRRALRERLAKRVPAAKVHYLDGTEEGMRTISREIRRAPIDAALLGMGEQGQIGFNVRPADFDTDDAYISVQTADRTLVTVSIREMMRMKRVIICAPYGIHAENVWQVMTHRLSPDCPATALKLHGNVDFLLDRESAAKIGVSLAAEFNPELEMYRVMNGCEDAETEE